MQVSAVAAGLLLPIVTRPAAVLSAAKDAAGKAVDKAVDKVEDKVKGLFKRDKDDG